MIKKPTNANIIPPNLNWASFISFNLSNIFLIFEGNKAYKEPSINKNSPKATIISLIVFTDLIVSLLYPQRI